MKKLSEIVKTIEDKTTEFGKKAKTHLKKNWKKYAIGALAVGAAAVAVNNHKHHDEQNQEEEEMKYIEPVEPVEEEPERTMTVQYVYDDTGEVAPLGNKCSEGYYKEWVEGEPDYAVPVNTGISESENAEAECPAE